MISFTRLRIIDTCTSSSQELRPQWHMPCISIGFVEKEIDCDGLRTNLSGNDLENTSKTYVFQNNGKIQ